MPEPKGYTREKLTPPYFVVREMGRATFGGRDIRSEYDFSTQEEAEAYVDSLKGLGFKGIVSIGKAEDASHLGNGVTSINYLKEDIKVL